MCCLNSVFAVELFTICSSRYLSAIDCSFLVCCSPILIVRFADLAVYIVCRLLYMLLASILMHCTFLLV